MENVTLKYCALCDVGGHNCMEKGKKIVKKVNWKFMLFKITFCWLVPFLARIECKSGRSVSYFSALGEQWKNWWRSDR